MRPHPEHCIQLWTLQHKKKMDLLEQVLRDRGMEHLCYEGQVRELGLFSLENIRIWETIQPFPVPKGDTRELERDTTKT